MFAMLNKGMLRPLILPLAAALMAPLPSAAFAQDGYSQSELRREIGKRAEKDVRAFYAARNNAPLWLDAAGRPNGAASLLLFRLRTAQFDGLDPDKFKPARLAKRLDQARRGGDADDLARAEVELSSAFAAYVRATRGAARLPMIYESEALEPVVPTVGAALQAAARADSLEHYVDDMGWMHPLNAP